MFLRGSENAFGVFRGFAARPYNSPDILLNESCTKWRNSREIVKEER
jgi:hypothetical protein